MTPKLPNTSEYLEQHYLPFRFCPKCGTELVPGKRVMTGYDPFTGAPQFHTPLACPGRGRWWKRCDW